MLLASSLIPGNENAVYRVINGLTRWGANVVHKGNAKVHVSGHASAGELALLLQHRQPAQRACRCTASGGTCAPTPTLADRAPACRRERRASPRTASSSTSSTGRPGSPARSPCGYVYVDGMTVGDVTEASLKDRRILAEEGFVTVVCIVDADTGKLTEDRRTSWPAASCTTTRLRRRRAGRSRRRWPRRPRRASATAPARAAGAPRRQPLGAPDAYRRSPMIIPIIIDA